MKRLFIILSVILLSGCIRDKISETPATTGRTVTFSLVSGTGEQSDKDIRMTRAEGEAALNENYVGRLDVFFFDDAGQCLFYPSSSQMTRSGNKVTISVPEADALTLFNRNLTLYILANCTLSRDDLSGKSLGQVASLVQQNTFTLNPGPFVPQEAFLMDGALPISGLSESRTNLGSISLRRAAAKVVVSIADAAVPGYIPVNATVRMNNYIDKTVLGSSAPYYTPSAGDFKHSPLRDAYIPNNGGTPFATPPFYSYANDWENGSAKESYVTICVRWRKQDDGTEKNYYYRIPFNYIPPDAADGRNHRLRRNHIYTFNVNISVLGGLDPEEAVVLAPNFEFKDWTTDHILAILNQYDYLVVSETDILIHDITTKTINYTSSRPITVTITDVYYYQLHSSGSVQRMDYLPGDTKYPVISIDEAAGTITVTSPIPVNYVPVNIYFTVSNGTGVVYKVKVTQFPRQYFTYSFSDISYINSMLSWYGVNTDWYDGQKTFYWDNGKGNPNTGMTNFNFYTVTTSSISPDDPFVLGGDITTTGNLSYYGDYIQTKTDVESNRVVSPKFVIASQRGIAVPLIYLDAQRRCQIYSEGPYPHGTWRMPTLAEMELICRLQKDTNSAIKDLFVPGSSSQDHWWVAQYDKIGTQYQYYSYNMVTSSLVKHPLTTNPYEFKSSIRCVHDVWKD